MSAGLVFAIAYAVAFTLLAGTIAATLAIRRRSRMSAFGRLLRARSSLYAQMNALLPEFQRLARMDTGARVEAVSPTPSASPTGELMADVVDRLSIAAIEVDVERAPKELRGAAVALDEAITVLLEGLRGVLGTSDAAEFVGALPSASPTANAEPLKRADRELRGFAESQGLDYEEFFYQDASFYV